jgi:hypothetical protein
VTALTVPDVLRRAERVLARRGWCREDYEDEQGRVCAEGAINLAAYGNPYPTDETPDDQYRVAESATKAVMTHLEVPTLVNWTDETAQDAAEVRAALLAAAQRAEAAQADRPYRCEGCGKTSRIARHEPGCPVAAAFDREAGTA